MNPIKQRLALACAIGALGGASVMSSPVQAFDAPRHEIVADADAKATAQESIDKGLAYLKAHQDEDGGWQGAKGPPALTAITLRAFMLDGDAYNAKTDFVAKGYAKLLQFQMESGGIYKDLLANYNTAIAISALAASDNPDHKKNVEKAVEYLKSLQWTDKITGGPKGEHNIDVKNPWFGGAGYGGSSRPDGSNTQLFLDALHDAGIPKDDPAYKNAVAFITRMQNNSETNDQPWSGNDGGFIYSPADGGQSPAGFIEGPDGKKVPRSYGSMTYAGLKSMIYCGVSKDDPRVKKAWDWISKNWTLDENPGMKLGNAEAAHQGMFYYFHTLAQALEAYGETTITDPAGGKHDWRVELIAKLKQMQQADGTWKGDKRWMEDNPVLATSYAVLALEIAKQDLAKHPPQ